MKTLLLTADFPPRVGGIARYYADLARGLGPECTVAVGSWDGSPPQVRGDPALLELPFDSAASHRPWNLVRARRLLASQVAQQRPELLVCGTLRPFARVCEHLARRSGIPWVQIHHGGDLLKTARRWRSHPIKRRRWRRLVDGPALHLANSRYTAKLAERLGLPADRIEVVPPEVDTRHFAPAESFAKRAALRRTLGFEEDQIVTVFCGRLVPRKGLADVIAALASLPADVRVAVAGPGDRASWQRRAEAVGVASRVQFLGDVDYDDLPDLYRAADLFIGPSRDTEAIDDPESFGIVFLEAAASGLAVLATRIGGVPEAVEDGVSGLLVSPGDIAELAAGWRRLAADAALRRAMGRAGRSGRAQRYGPGSSARALQQAVQRLAVPD